MLMKFFEGALTEDAILKMPYKRFIMYNDYMLYLMRVETEEGRRQNKIEDRTLEMEYFSEYYLNKPKGLDKFKKQMLNFK